MTSTLDPPEFICDHCQQRLHRDQNGWYVGQDGTSDCPVDDEGHSVKGRYR